MLEMKIKKYNILQFKTRNLKQKTFLTASLSDNLLHFDLTHKCRDCGDVEDMNVSCYDISDIS